MKGLKRPAQQTSRKAGLAGPNQWIVRIAEPTINPSPPVGWRYRRDARRDDRRFLAIARETLRNSCRVIGTFQTVSSNDAPKRKTFEQFPHAQYPCDASPPPSQHVHVVVHQAESADRQSEIFGEGFQAFFDPLFATLEPADAAHGPVLIFSLLDKLIEQVYS